MPFMEPQTLKGQWYVLTDVNGDIDFVEQDDIMDVIQSNISMMSEGHEFTIEFLGEKVGARLSAPGYMDRTEWLVADTEEEAMEELRELYQFDDEED